MPDTLTALAIVVLFFLPGYVAASVFFRNSPYARPGDIQFVLQIALWAAVVHVLAYPLTAPLIQVWRSDPFLTNETGRFLAWFIAVVLIEPVILGVALGQLLRAGQVQTFLSNFGMSFTDQSPTALGRRVRSRCARRMGRSAGTRGHRLDHARGQAGREFGGRRQSAPARLVPRGALGA